MRFTINLLPPEKQRALRASVVVSAAQGILASFLALSLIGAATLVSLRFVLIGAQKDLTSRSEQVATDSGSPEAEVRAIDAYLKRLDLAHRESLRWSELLVALAAVTPEGVRLQRFDVATSGAVTLRGVAATRDDVLYYDDALRASGLFTDVSSPLSNLLQRTNVTFEFTAVYTPLADLAL